MNKLFKQQFGFSLLEVMAATTVIAIGLIGVLALVIQNIKVQHTYKNTLTASQLAQEALELARNVRDKNWLTAGAAYYAGIAVLDGAATSTIYFDGSNVATTSAASVDDASAKLYIDADGFYTHNITATSTIFSRVIVTANDYAASSTVLKAEVGWTDRGEKRNYVAETVLYDWR